MGSFFVIQSQILIVGRWPIFFVVAIWKRIFDLCVHFKARGGATDSCSGDKDWTPFEKKWEWCMVAGSCWCRTRGESLLWLTETSVECIAVLWPQICLNWKIQTGKTCRRTLSFSWKDIFRQKSIKLREWGQFAIMRCCMLAGDALPLPHFVLYQECEWRCSLPRDYQNCNILGHLLCILSHSSCTRDEVLTA